MATFKPNYLPLALSLIPSTCLDLMQNSLDFLKNKEDTVQCFICVHSSRLVRSGNQYHKDSRNPTLLLLDLITESWKAVKVFLCPFSLLILNRIKRLFWHFSPMFSSFPGLSWWFSSLNGSSIPSTMAHPFLLYVSPLVPSNKGTLRVNRMPPGRLRKW